MTCFLKHVSKLQQHVQQPMQHAHVVNHVHNTQGELNVFEKHAKPKSCETCETCETCQKMYEHLCKIAHVANNVRETPVKLHAV